jgi:ankyrin repeat protein
MECVYKSVSQWLGKNASDSCFVNEDWNALQLIASLSDEIEILNSIIDSGANLNHQSDGIAVPCITPLHIAISNENINITKHLIKSNCDVNILDQHGFTPLHYAVLKRNKDLVILLIDNGANVNKLSNNNCTSLHLATVLKYSEIEDILASKIKSEIDPSLPKFKEWLSHLGAGEYLMNFISAGYDLYDIYMKIDTRIYTYIYV